MQVTARIPDPDFLAGIVTAHGVSVAPSPPQLAQRLDALVAQRAAEDFPPAVVKDAIRNMLRKGGFRPAGRSKPASEYLAQAAREGRFPRINNLVDINNLVSLQTGLPISMLDLDAVGPAAELRYGRPGERYIFNPAGQEIDLAGLVCLCRADGGLSTPLGNAIKDSMAGKVKEQTTAVMGVIYACTAAVDPARMDQILVEFGELLVAHAGATEVVRQVLGSGRD